MISPDQAKKRLALALMLQLKVTELEANLVATSTLRVLNECGLITVDLEGMTQLSETTQAWARFIVDHKDTWPKDAEIPQAVASLLIQKVEVLPPQD